jgi:hypothetical protein
MGKVVFYTLLLSLASCREKFSDRSISIGLYSMDSLSDWKTSSIFISGEDRKCVYEIKTLPRKYYSVISENDWININDLLLDFRSDSSLDISYFNEYWEIQYCKDGKDFRNWGVRNNISPQLRKVIEIINKYTQDTTKVYSEPFEFRTTIQNGGGSIPLKIKNYTKPHDSTNKSPVLAP